MATQIKGLALLAAMVFSLLAQSSALAATSAIGAKVVFTQGEAQVISAKTSKSSPIGVGTLIEEGDRIKTSRNGIVEVEFDNGDLIRVDKDTDMTIRSLHRDESGSTFSIFNLVLGRVKSAVSKLVTAQSKFEYHTKAAICGVGGTPPFIVEFRDNAVNVDLLGQAGDPGHVFVQAFDPAKTMVTLLAGTHTMARFGAPPLPPAPISPARIQMLNRTIPFSSKIREERRGGGPSGPGREGPSGGQGSGEGGNGQGEPTPPPPPPTGFGGPTQNLGENLVTGTLTNNLSTPRQVNPGNALTITGLNNQTTSQQGALGTETQSGAGASSNLPPPMATFTINVNFR